MKYCNRCGAQLITTTEGGEIQPSEKRFDEYLDGLFWLTVFGLALILGGAALMKNGLHLSDRLVMAYVILSSSAFLVNFALNLWGLFRINKSSREPKSRAQIEQVDTHEFLPVKAEKALEPAPSIIEGTTRELESKSPEKIPSSRPNY
jgi:hypothetical protein